MAKLIDLAQMSEAVYDSKTSPGTVVGRGWSCTQVQRASGVLSGFQAAIFIRSGETVVAFRGTDQGMDVVADLKLGAGMNSTYFDRGVKFTSDHTSKRSNVTLTGHSLGGAIAQVVANRTGLVMASFNAPGVAVIASRNIFNSNMMMNAVRAFGMFASMARHPEQAASDMANAFRIVKGVNLCLNSDKVSQIGNHYGRVMRIPGTSSNPISEHRISTVISVLSQPNHSRLAARSANSF